MKPAPTIFKFSYRRPYYSCNQPTDNSGQYVLLHDYNNAIAELEKAQKMIEELQKQLAEVRRFAGIKTH